MRHIERTLAALTLATLLCTSVATAQVERRMEVFDLAFLSYPGELRSGYLPAAPGHRSEVYFEYDEVTVLEFDEEELSTSPWLSANEVQEAVHRFISEDSWNNVRNRLTVDDEEGRRLVVVQTPQVLKRIERFLSRLQQRCVRVVSVELLLVPPTVLDGIRPGWDDPESDPWFDAVVLDEVLKAGKDRTAFLSAVAPEGAWKRLEPRSLSRQIVDYEVNQTGVLPVVGPVVQTLATGTFGEVLVLPAPDRSWCRVDVKLGDTFTGPDPERRKLDYGELELTRHADSQVTTSVLLPFGKAVLVGSFRSAGDNGETGPRSFAGLLAVRRGADDGEARAGDEGLPATLDASLLLEPRPTSTLGRLRAPDPYEEEFGPLSFTVEEEEPSAALLERDYLLKALRQRLPEKARSDAGPGISLHGGTLVVDSVHAEAVAQRVEELARKHARLLAIDLWQVSVSEDDLARLGGNNSEPDAAWLKSVAAKPGFRSRVVGLGGWPLAVGAVAGRNYVVDVEHVSGGTGKAVVEAGDPVVSAALGGLLLTARAEPVPGTSWVQLRLEGESGRPPVFERQKRTRSAQDVRVRKTAEGTNEAEPESGWITVDLPDHEADRWNHVVTLVAGKPALLSALPDITRPGRTRVLVVTVRPLTLPGHAKTQGF